MMDTCFNYIEKDKGFFSSDESKWINKIRKLKEQYPDDVKIIRQPEDNDGCIYCELPVGWLKIQPKRECRKLTEEERMVAAERLARAREERLKNKSSSKSQ